MESVYLLDGNRQNWLSPQSLSGFQIFPKFTSDGGSSFRPISGATRRPPFCHPLMCGSKVLPGCQRLSSDTSAAINWGLKARRTS